MFKIKAVIKILAVLVVLFSSVKAQQLTNGSLDTWYGFAPQVPTGWSTIDQFLANYDEPFANLIFVTEETRPADIYSDTAAARIQTGYSATASGTVPGILSAGNIFLNNNNIALSKVPFAFRPDSIFFALKYVPVGNDTPVLAFAFTVWDPDNDSIILVAGSTVNYYKLLYGDTAYAVFESAPGYYNSDTPDSLLLGFLSSGGGQTTLGSSLWVDDVQFVYNGTSSDVKNLALNTAVSLFPVPATTTLTVRVSEQMVHNTYGIMDVFGNVVARGTISGATYNLDVSSLAAGPYSYAIIDNNERITAQGKFLIAR